VAIPEKVQVGVDGTWIGDFLFENYKPPTQLLMSWTANISETHIPTSHSDSEVR
jgi:hypothetical protein